MTEIIDKFTRRLDDYQNELKTGTATKNLSRKDLKDISDRLPPKDKWGDDDFGRIKWEIRQDYKLCNRKLSDAINLIKENRTMGANIGINFSLKHVSDDKLRVIFNKQANFILANVTTGEPSVRSPNFDRICNHVANKASLIKELKDKFTEEELADIEAIYSIGSQTSIYCEFYEEEVARCLNSHQSKSAQLDYLLGKANFCKFIINGLYVLGSVPLAQDLKKVSHLST